MSSNNKSAEDHEDEKTTGFFENNLSGYLESQQFLPSQDFFATQLSASSFVNSSFASQGEPEEDKGVLELTQFYNTQRSKICSQQSIQNPFHTQGNEEISFLEEDSQLISNDEQSEIVHEIQNNTYDDEDQPSSHQNNGTQSPVPVKHHQELDVNVPDSVIELYNSIKKHYSDWTFVAILSGYLCTDTFPMGAYINLKLSLLLSIASIHEASFKMPIPIVTVGQETANACIIMNAIGKFAERFIISTLNFDGSTVAKDNVIEAGPHIIARNGIFFIGDWSRLPQKTVMKFLREIETGQIITEKVQQIESLQCAIWTYWNCSTKIQKNQATISQFMNVFGIPIMLDDLANEEDIIDDLLDQASSEPTDRFDSFHISEEDMSQYLRWVAQQQSEMEESAATLLRNYFTATTKIRPSQ